MIHDECPTFLISNSIQLKKKQNPNSTIDCYAIKVTSTKMNYNFSVFFLFFFCDNNSYTYSKVTLLKDGTTDDKQQTLL